MCVHTLASASSALPQVVDVQKPAQMKLKVEYVENGQVVSETADVGNLPNGL
jgi:hypothetical protein